MGSMASSKGFSSGGDGDLEDSDSARERAGVQVMDEGTGIDRHPYDSRGIYNRRRTKRGNVEKHVDHSDQQSSHPCDWARKLVSLIA